MQPADEIASFLRHYLEPALLHSPEGKRLASYCAVEERSRGSLLIEMGKRHAGAYYLLRGCARSFYLKDGLEVNTWFAFAGEPIASLQNYLGRPAHETVELLEDARLIIIDMAAIKADLQHFPAVNMLILRMLEEYAAFLEERLYALQFSSSMDRYRYLLEREPELLQRVSLTHIASYLGISRETLSRMRGRIL